MEDTFSIFKAFSEGFAMYTKRPFALSGYYLLFALFTLPLSVVGMFFSSAFPPIIYPISIINGIFGNLSSATMATIGFGIEAEKKGEEPPETELSSYLMVIVSGFLYQLLVGIGFILLIIPGFYWSIKYMFYYFFIVEDDCGPIEALGESGDLTDGYKWKLFLLSIMLYIFNLIGTLFLGIGIFVTGPVSVLVLMSVYRQLKRIQEEEMDQYFPAVDPEPQYYEQEPPTVVTVTEVEVLEEYSS